MYKNTVLFTSNLFSTKTTKKLDNKGFSKVFFNKINLCEYFKKQYKIIDLTIA